MAYRRNNSGCGCLLVFFIVVGILSGIRGCTEKMINGDLKMPKFGSSRVSGGSGGYSTSNGYNVKYNQTTSPNYNSSSNDYTNTNSLPTEYREGKQFQNSNNSSNHSYSNESSHSQPQGSSYTSTQESPRSTIDEIVSEYEKQFTTCPICHGSGEVIMSWTFTGESGNPCIFCWKTEKHEHINEPKRCNRCFGSGKVRVDEEN